MRTTKTILPKAIYDKITTIDASSAQGLFDAISEKLQALKVIENGRAYRFDSRDPFDPELSNYNTPMDTSIQLRVSLAGDVVVMDISIGTATATNHRVQPFLSLLREAGWTIDQNVGMYPQWFIVRAHSKVSNKPDESTNLLKQMAKDASAETEGQAAANTIQKLGTVGTAGRLEVNRPAGQLMNRGSGLKQI